jgi:preprotein translocase subunit SecD
MKPVIREPILGGSGQVVGRFTVDEARQIAQRLQAGTSRLEVEIVGQ